MQFLLGCDPEFFLMKNGKHVSAEAKIGGSKWKPIPIDNKGNAIQEDNVAVEFNIEPAQTFLAFKNNIHKVLNYLQNKLKGFEFSTQSAVVFDDDQLNTAQARLFGCDPDFNAWTYEVNPRPRADNMNLRSAGGHIHIGCELAKEKPTEIIKACDLYLGVPSIILDPGTERRKLYGKAGSFRKKDYGVEYRSLSNFWIFNDNNILWVYNQVFKALEFVSENKIIDTADEQLIQDCINNSDLTYYHYLTEKYNV